MPLEIKLPELGDGIESADVLEVLVAEGDTIDVEDGVVELETDKATAVVPSDKAGKVIEIHVAEGDTIPVGTLLVTLEPVESSKQDSQPAQEPPQEEEAESKQESKQEPAEAEPDQTSPPGPGKLPETKSSRQDTSQDPQQQSSQHPPQAPNQPDHQRPVHAEEVAHSASSTGADPAEIPAGPAMRRFAREVGVDLSRVSGTGNGGRITRNDILSVVRSGTAKSTAKSTGEPAEVPGESDDFGPVRVEKLSRMRQTIARQMHESWTHVPRVTNFDDADVTDLESIRQASKQDYLARDIKLTSMPFVIKSIAMALRDHPIINASISPDGQQVIYKQYINIGIAVDTERGLVVPTMRNVDNLSIPQIASQLGELAEKVRNKNFTREDLQGGTFTISNLGAIGGTYSTPIINVPETSIILVGRSRKVPVVKDDKIVPRLMMPLSISYDHRLIDGASAARFLNDVIAFLEAPSRLLLAP